MSAETETVGWVIRGFDAWVGLWVWLFAVLAYALVRSILRPAPDSIRLSGPVD